jgi:ATP-dependent Clp protease ATP-binding subunit ClpX
MEEVMLDIMYELPSLSGVVECVIDEHTVRSRSQPILIREKKAS